MTGSGEFGSSVFGKIDIEEARRQPTNRILTRGVFPEMAPDEEGPDHPFDPRARQLLRPILARDTRESEPLAGFTDQWDEPGARHASVTVRRTDDGLRVRVTVRGVDLDDLAERDRAMERVHIAFDVEHDHTTYRHFMLTADDHRNAWIESYGGLLTLFKHVATDAGSENRQLGCDGWTATISPSDDGYDVTFNISRTALGVTELPPVAGMDVWLEYRWPNYGQVWLCPPRYRPIADPFSFTDLYLTETPVVLTEIDYDLPRWENNTCRIVLSNVSGNDVEVTLQTETRLSTQRWISQGDPVTTTVNADGNCTVDLPYYLNPEEKMSGTNHVTLRVMYADQPIFVSRFSASYASIPGTFHRYGSVLGQPANPTPGDKCFVRRKTRYVCSRIPEFDRLTTRNGAASDFVLRAQDGSIEFNLMQAGVLDQMARWIENTFDNDVDRVLGMFFLKLNPAVCRHASGGHRIVAGFNGLSLIRANFAGGSGNCGYNSVVFAVMASHLRLDGQPNEPFVAHTGAVWGHVISGFAWHGSKVLIDADVGHFMLTEDGTDFATVDRFKEDARVLTTAGSGELGRYYTANEAAIRRATGLTDASHPCVFPPGAPKG